MSRRPSPAPGQVWWSPSLGRFAVVFEVWGRSVRVVLMSADHARPPTSRTWATGAPRGWDLYYQGGS